MTSSADVCQACGCTAANREGFQILRPNPTDADARQRPAAESILCPACAAKFLQSGNNELAYGFCDQCAATVEANRLEMRSKTVTIPGNVPPHHRSVTMALCPKCVRAYDGTGKSLIVGVRLFFAGIALLALVSWLLS